MKIKITYLQEEKRQADELASLYIERLSTHRRLTVKRSDRYKPYYHIYIADMLDRPPKNEAAREKNG